MSNVQGVRDAVLSIMDEIGQAGIGKSGWNDHSKYKYRSIEDVLGAFNRLMVKHGLTIEHRKLSHETDRAGKQTYVTVEMEYVFTGPDGSTMRQVYGGCGGDVGDKAMAKAQTNAYKYMLTSVFNIPVQGMVDGDADTPDRNQGEEQAQREQLEAERAYDKARDRLLVTGVRKGMNADQVAEWCVQQYGGHPKDASVQDLVAAEEALSRMVVDGGSAGTDAELQASIDRHPASRVKRSGIPGQRPS
jgi:hypothetical protein